MNVESIIASELQLGERAVAATIALLRDGATIPFISRYRKEATGSLDEVAVFNISTRLQQLDELAHRQEFIIETIDSQGKLTDDLKSQILSTIDPTALEDIYLPFKPRRRTRAQIARERGLEPLAKMIMAQSPSWRLDSASRFVGGEVADARAAVEGASDIIAEWVSEHRATRQSTRRALSRECRLTVSVVKGKEREADQYRNYFDFSLPLNRCLSHQVLAVLRAEKEGLLKWALEADDEKLIERVQKYFIRDTATKEAREIIAGAIKDCYKRLLRPSLDTDIIAEAKEKADDVAIATFAQNLRQLLLASPLGRKRVMAIDPGFRTGCKVVCLDEQGNLLHHDVIYPTPPHNDRVSAMRLLAKLVDRYAIDAISLGNGTASRETERFLKTVDFPRKVDIFVVSESGASIYSASKIARDEFPDKDVTVRGAVSIGRRLLDPLAELVKIDPKSIGVGQYQHDVDQKKLMASLDMTVEACVNSVGVNLNTASSSLLSYVAGIGEAMAARIVAYRTENGDFACREDLLKVPRFGQKAFQQAAGFLRIPGAENVLDNSAVHPESYSIVNQMAKDLGLSVDELVGEKERIAQIELSRYVSDSVGLPTLTDIVAELQKPGRDPRSVLSTFSFDPTVNDIVDLKIGMELPGIVNNITQFGAFVDIGIHQSGLVHLSQLSDRYVKDASKVVALNQHVMVKVIDVDVDRGRVSLSMKGVDQSAIS